MLRKFLFGFAACLGILLAGTLRAQDDDSAAPPAPTDNGSSMVTAPDSNAPTGPDNGGDGSVTFQTFYDALGSLGTWIQSSDYGYVWQPQVNDPNWAPYTNGHWVYSDEGWTWVSDEPWGWATYHYGRWVNLDGTGWVWVPGYTWAPAWVSWRYGDGDVGWAPLPPDSFVGIDYSQGDEDMDDGFHIGGDCDSFYGIGPGCYIFLPVLYLGYDNYHGYYRDRHDNYRRINHTTNVTNINVARGANGAGAAQSGGFHHVTTGGPSIAQVDAVASVPVQRVNLVASSRAGEATINGHSLAVYAPHVNPIATGQPARVTGSIGLATINHGVDIQHPLAINATLSPPAPTPEQVQQARLAQSHAPANAKVMTANAVAHPILQGPLTTLRPTARVVGSMGVTAGTAPAIRTYSTTPRASGQDVTPTRSYQPYTIHAAPSSSHPEARSSAPATPVTRPSVPVAPQSERSSGAYSSGGASRGGQSAPYGGGGGGNSGGYQGR